MKVEKSFAAPNPLAGNEIMTNRLWFFIFYFIPEQNKENRAILVH